jgi:proteasome lid subunit RPN8/RPN11
MTPETRQAIQKHAAAEYPRESCGLIVDGAYRPCTNAAQSGNEHFVISKTDYAEAEDAGEIQAVVHSHPNASPQPSDADRVQCEASGLEWHIISVGMVDGAPEFSDLVSLRPSGYEAPLIGREFAHGVLDCYTLLQDYYRRELGVELANFDREDDWWHKGQDLYSAANIEGQGFQLFKPDEVELQEGDLIFMQVRAPVENHAAIYIGNNMILQHLYGRPSGRTPYGGLWRAATRKVARYVR